jgi:hypothetical protein
MNGVWLCEKNKNKNKIMPSTHFDFRNTRKCELKPQGEGILQNNSPKAMWVEFDWDEIKHL